MKKIKIIEESRFLTDKEMGNLTGGNGPLVCGNGKIYNSCSSLNNFRACTDNFYVGSCITMYIDCDYYASCDDGFLLCSKIDNFDITIEY